MPSKLSSISAADWITVQARAQPNARCLVEADGTVHTFGDVSGRVNRLASALRGCGLDRGDRIGILDTDSVAYMELQMASLIIGTTYVPLNYRLALPEIELLARTAQLDALVTSTRYADMVPAILQACPGLKLLAAFDDGVPDAISIPSLIAGIAEDATAMVVTGPEDIVSLMFTSGTTGRPKGVMQSLRMLTAGTNGALVEFGFRTDELRYTASPMFHAAGSGCIYYGIARGFASLVMPQYNPTAVAAWMRDGLTGMLLMPTMLSALLDLPEVRAHSYPALRSIMYGGSPITPALLRDALAVFGGCDFYNSFGAGTEAAGQCILRPDDHRLALNGRQHLLGSIGRPVYGVDLRLCDDELNDVADGQVGEICTRSEWVMSGYLEDPERTGEAVVDGWFRAGDLAWRDEDGYLYLAGRSTDMIIRGGENVYPIEIESVLADHPSVHTGVVIGLPDDHWGEIIAAVIELQVGHEWAPDELRAMCRSRLASYKVPEQFIRVEPGELSRNVNGKVQKHIVRASIGS